jgi:hypothetical protein
MGHVRAELAYLELEEVVEIVTRQLPFRVLRASRFYVVYGSSLNYLTFWPFYPIITTISSSHHFYEMPAKISSPGSRVSNVFRLPTKDFQMQE